MIGTIHIVPRGDLWGVVREGDDCEIASFVSHHDAVQIAHEVAGQEHVELVLHERNVWPLPETSGDWWSG